MTEMRPDTDSDEAGQASEYGNDTGFAAEATRSVAPEVDSQAGTDGGETTTGGDGAETTTTDPGEGAD